MCESTHFLNILQRIERKDEKNFAKELFLTQNYGSI